MTAGKAVALFVAWFALTVALFGVGVIAVTSDVPLAMYSLFEDEPQHAIGRINDAAMIIFAGVLPIVIVAWKRERIYTLLDGDLTNVRRALALFVAGLVLMIAVNALWVVMSVVMPVSGLVLVVITSPLFEYNLDWLGFLTLHLFSIIIRVILPVVIVVWKRQAIYSILRVG